MGSLLFWNDSTQPHMLMAVPQATLGRQVSAASQDPSGLSGATGETGLSGLTGFTGLSGATGAQSLLPRRDS